MSKPSPAGCSRLNLLDLDLLATKNRLVIRKSSKFTASGFLQSLLNSVVTGLASFNQLAASLKEQLPAPMVRQSLHERLGIRSTAFLMAVLYDLMEQLFRPAAAALGGTGIRRVLIEDASGQVMPKSNAGNFPAHGNHRGAAAGVKIDLAFDLLSGTIVSHSLHAATEQDENIGRDFVAEVGPGDLVLRDIVYLSLGGSTPSRTAADVGLPACR